MQLYRPLTSRGLSSCGGGGLVGVAAAPSLQLVPVVRVGDRAQTCTNPAPLVAAVGGSGGCGDASQRHSVVAAALCRLKLPWRGLAP